MSKGEECPNCGRIIQKDERTECYKCRCSRKFAKNGIATSESRLNVAIPHLAEKKNVWQKMFNLR
jgi:ribosomal protein L37AE/L43A